MHSRVYLKSPSQYSRCDITLWHMQTKSCPLGAALIWLNFPWCLFLLIHNHESTDQPIFLPMSQLEQAETIFKIYLSNLETSLGFLIFHVCISDILCRTSFSLKTCWTHLDTGMATQTSWQRRGACGFCARGNWKNMLATRPRGPALRMGCCWHRGRRSTGLNRTLMTCKSCKVNKLAWTAWSAWIIFSRIEHNLKPHHVQSF